MTSVLMFSDAWHELKDWRLRTARLQAFRTKPATPARDGCRDCEGAGYVDGEVCGTCKGLGIEPEPGKF